jgi:hypothetical protein
MPRSRDYRRALDAQISEAILAAERCEAEGRAHRNTVEVLKGAKAAAEKAAPAVRKPRTPKAVRFAPNAELTGASLTTPP